MVICLQKGQSSLDMDCTLGDQTRQVVAYAIGDRSGETCKKLWNSIPKEYREGQCYTDFWQAYQAIIPEDQHTAKA
jgi:IS1 family transposase